MAIHNGQLHKRRVRRPRYYIAAAGLIESPNGSGTTAERSEGTIKQYKQSKKLMRMMKGWQYEELWKK